MVLKRRSRWVVPLQAAIFFAAGMYRGMWRYASVPDVQRIAVAVAVSTLALSLMLVMLPPQQPPVPRSVILLDPILLILLLGGSRLGYRVWKERSLRNLLGSPGKPVVILGAGDAAADLLKHLARAGDWRVLGLLDDNPAKRGRQIQGVNVLGALDASDLRITKVAVLMIHSFIKPHPPRNCRLDAPG